LFVCNCPDISQKHSDRNGLMKRSPESFGLDIILYPAFKGFLIMVFDAEECL
jgi:hypothetical protein